MKTIKNLLIVTIPTFILLFLILETASRIFFPGSDTPSGYYDEDHNILKFNRDYGKTGLWTKGNLAQLKSRWHINNDGWNSPVDYYTEKKEGVKRIAVIGDSYIEAFQVDIDKSYPYVLDNMLGEEFEVYTFGRSGAQLSQYLHMSRYIEKKYSPDIYIFTLLHNDFDESVHGLDNKPMYLTIKIENDSLIEIQPVKPDRAHQKMPLSSIFRMSSFARFLFHNIGIRDMFRINREAEKDVEMNVYIEDVLSQEYTIHLVTTYILRTLKAELKNKKLLFIMDAPRWQIYAGELEKAKSRRLNILAGEICNILDLHFIDLTPHMVEDYKKNEQRYETDYDGHWNEYGHKFVANVIYRYLNNKIEIKK